MPNLEKLAKTLEDVKRRKGMFFLPNAEAAMDFLTGFVVAIGAAGAPVSWNSWRDALEHRGWRLDSLGFLPLMKASGLDDDQIADELIDALVEHLRRAGSSHSTE